MRGEQSISELCRREGIAANLYYRWSKDFLEAGKKQLAGDTVCEATSDEVKELRAENSELKEVVAESPSKPGARLRWNAIPKAVQDEVLDLALERTELSPRELACRYTDEKRYFVSESSVYRILKKADLRRSTT